MKAFMDQDFLLGTDTARELYHGHAERLPIIDYHCHLDPKMVAEDYRFRSITELWLGGDHYKWRAMRTNGWANATSRATHRIGRNLKNGQRPCPTPCATRCIIGHIWNCARLSASTSC